METRFIDGKWEWWAKAVRNRNLPEFSDRANTLEEAKKAAARSIGLAVEAKWQNIGPAVELTD